MAEPGRGLVAEAGVIVAEVVLVARKDQDDLVRWVYLDIGKFSGLAETIDEAIRYQFETRHGDDDTGPCILAGPSCNSADVLYEKRPVQLPLGARGRRQGAHPLHRRLYDELLVGRLQRLPAARGGVPRLRPPPDGRGLPPRGRSPCSSPRSPIRTSTAGPRSRRLRRRRRRSPRCWSGWRRSIRAPDFVLLTGDLAENGTAGGIRAASARSLAGFDAADGGDPGQPRPPRRLRRRARRQPASRSAPGRSCSWWSRTAGAADRARHPGDEGEAGGLLCDGAARLGGGAARRGRAADGHLHAPPAVPDRQPLADVALLPRRRAGSAAIVARHPQVLRGGLRACAPRGAGRLGRHARPDLPGGGLGGAARPARSSEPSGWSRRRPASSCTSGAAARGLVTHTGTHGCA